MACATMIAGAIASAKGPSLIPIWRQPIAAPTPPSATAPQIPRPPSHIRKTAARPRPFSPK